MPKIKYGISNVYYAIATIAADGTATFGSPVQIPGARSLSLSANGDMIKYYADNIEWWTCAANNGYSGSLNLAYLPDGVREALLHEKRDSKDILLEDPNATAVHFALLGQFENDSKNRRFIFYNCVASRPDESGNTKEENISPEETSIPIEVGTIYNSSLSIYTTKAATTEDTASTEYNAWFTSVYTATALHT